MNLLANDIIVRKKNAIESVWLSQRLIMEVCEVSEEYLRLSRSKAPELRGTVIGFDKRFIALPIRNKGIGAIVSAKV